MCCYSAERDAEEQDKKRERENKKREQEKIVQAERARIRNYIADKQLLEDLKRQKRKEREKNRRKAEKLRLKLQKRKEKTSIKDETAKRQPHNISFDRNIILKYESLLYIEADIKRLLVIEWLHGKKRIVLNSEREIRRTRAGGFSAEKFQKFIYSKKENTIEWLIELLDKQGVLRPKYDKIKVVSKKEYLKEKLESYLKNIKDDLEALKEKIPETSEECEYCSMEKSK